MKRKSGDTVTDTLLDTAFSQSPVKIFNNNGVSKLILICEHASSFIPDALGNLGLAPMDRKSHATWDIGAQELSRVLSKKLDAVLIEGCISRLVYDCNRPPNVPSAFPTQSERIIIPGNQALGLTARQERTDAVYVPFRTTVQSILEDRRTAFTLPIVVTIHSFTPVYHGVPRHVEIGILHDEDPTFAQLMMRNAHLLPDRKVALNEPYAKSDGVTHSLAIYGVANGLPNVMLEVRNDLLSDATAIEAVAQDLLKLLLPAIAEHAADTPTPKGKDTACPIS